MLELLNLKKIMKKILFIMLLFSSFLHAHIIDVGPKKSIKSIKKAIYLAKIGDTIIVHKGTYKEGNIIIDKKVVFIGKDFPILDGQKKYEVLSVKADSVVVDGFKVIRSGHATLEDPCGIKVYNKKNVIIQNNILDDNFFGIYIQNGRNCLIKNNTIIAYGKEEQEIGNGIHCWKSDNLQIIANKISGHRDGIYFEFVTNSVIWRNISSKNIRYGLHFMFSHNNVYTANVFKNNDAGIAVMYSRNVGMFKNKFLENWGDGVYGLLLKDLTFSKIKNNIFRNNTVGIFMDGASKVDLYHNEFVNNGWGLKINANCMENRLMNNNFENNTFDVSTSGSLVMNSFRNNYWDKYEGYDLDKDKIGDVPFHPLSLYAVLAEKNSMIMLLYRTFFVEILDRSEKLVPSLTPENFVDEQPMMKPNKI